MRIDVDQSQNYDQPLRHHAAPDSHGGSRGGSSVKGLFAGLVLLAFTGVSAYLGTTSQAHAAEILRLSSGVKQLETMHQVSLRQIEALETRARELETAVAEGRATTKELRKEAKEAKEKEKEHAKLMAAAAEDDRLDTSKVREEISALDTRAVAVEASLAGLTTGPEGVKALAKRLAELDEVEVELEELGVRSNDTASVLQSLVEQVVSIKQKVDIHTATQQLEPATIAAPRTMAHAGLLASSHPAASGIGAPPSASPPAPAHAEGHAAAAAAKDAVDAAVDAAVLQQAAAKAQAAHAAAAGEVAPELAAEAAKPAAAEELAAEAVASTAGGAVTSAGGVAAEEAKGQEEEAAAAVAAAADRLHHTVNVDENEGKVEDVDAGNEVALDGDDGDDEAADMNRFSLEEGEAELDPDVVAAEEAAAAEDEAAAEAAEEEAEEAAEVGASCRLWWRRARCASAT